MLFFQAASHLVNPFILVRLSQVGSFQHAYAWHFVFLLKQVEVDVHCRPDSASNEVLCLEILGKMQFSAYGLELCCVDARVHLLLGSACCLLSKKLCRFVTV